WMLLPAAVASVLPQIAESQQIGPLNTVLCSQALIKTVGTATIQTLLTGVSGKIIYLCGWSMTNTGTAGTGSFRLLYGQSTACSVNGTNITSDLSVSNTSPATDHTQYASLNVPATTSATVNDLCVNVTSGVGGVIYIGQY